MARGKTEAASTSSVDDMYEVCNGTGRVGRAGAFYDGTNDGCTNLIGESDSQRDTYEAE